MISFNPSLKLIITDVDETIADLYTEAEPAMIKELSNLLEEGKAIFFVTGQGIESVQWRIINHISQQLRSHILVGHCSGAEVWGYDEHGNRRNAPFYSIYSQALNDDQKQIWRDLVQQLIKEFDLKTTPTMPISAFLEKVGSDPLAVMLEDRGPQITLEVVNGYDLSSEQVDKLETKIPNTHGSYDLRIPILERADQLFEKEGIPVTSRLGGNFAIDFAIKGISKTTSVKHVLEDENVLITLGLNKVDLQDASHIEIWGDKFSVIRGGTDRHMSEAVSKRVRSVDFREENPDEFLEEYNVVLWNGKKHLHHGLLEYLQSRYKS